LAPAQIPATEIWPEAIQNNTAKTKLALKFEHHQVMDDSVEGSSQVKQAERGNIPVVSSEQNVVVNLHDSGLSTVEPAIR